MHAAATALLAVLLQAAPALTDAEVRGRVEALLGAIDRPIRAAQWKALGPAALPVLAEVAAGDDRMPSMRSMALGALATVDPGRAEPLARALAEADGAPLTVRETAVRVLGRMLPPAGLRAALAPVLRAAPDAALRAVAAETLARHAPGMACSEVMDQASREPALDRLAFEPAAALCSGR
jgi:HEAT repeat protein